MAFVYAPKGTHPNSIDLSEAPWNRLSPSKLYPSGVPVPGTFTYAELVEPRKLDEVAMFADSVEGVWQGLKQIEGAIQGSQFEGKPSRRQGIPEGHDFGYRLLDYPEAKALIFIPTYLMALRDFQTSLLEELRERGQEQELALVDEPYRPDCLAEHPISPGALLVDLLNEQLIPYEQAHESLLNWGKRLLHARDEGLSVTPLVRQMSQRVLELGAHPSYLRTYQECAALFEMESLMTTAIRGICTVGDLDVGVELLSSWIEAKVLSPVQGRSLASCGPVTRFAESWFP